MKISELLKSIAHRPYAMPSSDWKYYQEWNNAIFIHWEIPVEMVRKIVPSSLNIDTIGGKTYISLVAFTMEKIRPKYLPALSIVSDFHEINLRAYIDNDNRKGVYFLNIEAEKAFSAFLSRRISGMPYEKSDIVRSKKSHVSKHNKKGFHLNAEFVVEDSVPVKTELDKWLTERYCLYVDNKNLMYRYEVHHKEWEIRNVKFSKLDFNYKIGEMDLSGLKPDLLHYSDGVKVVAWGKEKV